MSEKFIQVTSLSNSGKIFINVKHIGHFYGIPEKEEYGGEVVKEKHTRLGVTTHNNGGFEVKETPEEILKMIGS